MEFLNKIFSNESNETSSNVNWILLIDVSQLDEIIKKSNEKPIGIFKHSTRCGVSRMALNQFEQDYEANDKIDLYFLDLLSYRDISNEIASRFNVVHQSPQMIVVQNQIAIYNASHGDIRAELLVKLFNI